MDSAGQILLKPVAFVTNARLGLSDDHWGDVISELILTEQMPDNSLLGIEQFSHLEILFYFHLLKDDAVVFGLRHPRNNPAYPLTGIFSQRGRARPNKIGATIVKLVEHKTRSLVVQGLDAVNGTPVLDIKPVMKEFLPAEDVRQPAWSSDLMKDYWK